MVVSRTFSFVMRVQYLSSPHVASGSGERQVAPRDQGLQEGERLGVRERGAVHDLGHDAVLERQLDEVQLLLPERAQRCYWGSRRR